MSSLRVTTVLLPPAKGRSIDGDSRRPTSRGIPREVGRLIKTGENSRPTIGENSTAAHSMDRLPHRALNFQRNLTRTITLADGRHLKSLHDARTVLLDLSVNAWSRALDHALGG